LVAVVELVIVVVYGDVGVRVGVAVVVVSFMVVCS
jgi:hypothetical protein